jgi:hypothetical protein
LGLARLQTLCLDGCGIEGSGVAAIACSLRANGILERLRLSENVLGDEGALALADDLLDHNTTLQVLDLSCCVIGCVGAAAIGRSLMTNAALIELNLSHNNVGDDGARAFAIGLTSNTSLQVLELFSCQIEGIGALALGRLLQTNTVLEHLNVSSNTFGLEGTSALAYGLSANIGLKVFEVRMCGITTNGAKHLAYALQSNDTLERMDISRNMGIEAQGMKAFAECLSCNTSLVDLCMDGLRDRFTSRKAIRDLEVNRFRQEYLLRGPSPIPSLLPFIFARVSAKPSTLYLYIRENVEVLGCQN